MPERRQECIAEALSILKSWNPTRDTKCFVVDYSTAEINAIDSKFPNIAAYLCDFHQEQVGQRWPKAGKNRIMLGEQAMFLDFVKQIACARNVQIYQKSVENLRKSKLYTDNSKVEEYCEKVCLNCSEHWARAFCVQQAVNIVNTNNGIEAQNTEQSIQIQLSARIT